MQIVILSSLVFSVLLHQYHVSAKNKFITVAAFDPATAIINSFKCRIQKDRVFLEWIIDNNYLVKQIEVEVSADKNNYALAGLVFSTEKKDSDSYNFYEPAKVSRLFYRLKIVHKDQTIRYSDIVSPG